MKRLQRLIDSLTISAALKEGIRAYFEQAQALQSLEAENQHLDREVGRMAEKVVKAEERYAETAADLRSVRERRDQLSRDLTKLVEERNAYFLEVQTMRKNLDAITSDFQTYRDDTAKTIQLLKENGESWRQKSEVNRKCSDEETDRATKLEDERDEANRLLQGFKQAAERDAKTVDNLRSEVAILNELLERETDRKEYLEQQVATLQKAIDTMTQPAAPATEGN